MFDPSGSPRKCEMMATASSQPDGLRDEGSVQTRIAELIELIRSADYSYYILDAPILSDAEYDAAFRELRELEGAHPELVRPDSPTRILPGLPSAAFANVAHLNPLFSLCN